jgi:putrescine aminotransferase
MNPPLLSVDDCETLPVEAVCDYYRRFVNPGQVDVMSCFAFASDLVERAEGSWIVTRSGRRILDFTGGVGVLPHGHNHPRILRARRAFADRKAMEVHKMFFSPYLGALSRNMALLLPEDLDVAFFPNSGSEAVEGALKLAYKYHDGRRKHVLSADIAFHGKLLGAGSVSGASRGAFAFPCISGARTFTFGSIESVRTLVDSLRHPDGESDVYAIIIEPLSASTLLSCSPDFLSEVRALCTANDVILIFDEVYTGWARTGELFYFMRSGVVPDVLLTSKGLGGGKASIAAYVSRPAVFQRAYGRLSEAQLHSTTYNGMGEETVTALEAINVIVDEDFVGKARRIGAFLGPALRALRDAYPAIIEEVRGVGALQGLVLRRDAAILNEVARLLPADIATDSGVLERIVVGAVIDDLYRSHGILTWYGSGRDLPLMVTPALVVTEEELDYFVGRLGDTFGKSMKDLCIDFLRRWAARASDTARATW